MVNYGSLELYQTMLQHHMFYWDCVVLSSQVFASHQGNKPKQPNLHRHCSFNKDCFSNVMVKYIPEVNSWQLLFVRCMSQNVAMVPIMIIGNF